MGGVFTRNYPNPSNALLASDTILQYARRCCLDAAPVRVDAGDGDLTCGVGVEEEGDACGACFSSDARMSVISMVSIALFIKLLPSPFGSNLLVGLTDRE